MSIVPRFRSACELADQMPAMIAEFLNLDDALSRRFREDSLTDILIASFIRLPRGEVAALTPPESRTGGDFDLAICDPVGGTAFQYRIQAKRLYWNAANPNASVYRELAHPGGTGGQAQKLCDPANLAHPLPTVPTVPLYAFYNPEAACLALGALGVALADGHSIAALIQAGVAAKRTQPSYRRLTAVQPHFFDMATILCPPADPDGVRPKSRITPQQSRDAYVRATGGEERTSEDLVPPVGPLPDEYRSLLAEAEVDAIRRERRERPLIVLRGGTPDPRGERPAPAPRPLVVKRDVEQRRSSE